MAAECDVYVGIIAYRYGWIPDGKEVSITELEYDAAKRAGRPRFVFVLHEDISVHPGEDFDDGAERCHKQKKLEAFKAKYANDPMTAPFNDPTLALCVHHAVVESLSKRTGDGEKRRPRHSAPNSRCCVRCSAPNALPRLFDRKPIRDRLLMRCRALPLLFALVSLIGRARAAPGEPAPGLDSSVEEAVDESLSLHFQMTVAAQAHPSFSAAYSGDNSLKPGAQSATAFVSTLYLGARLWPGADLLFNPEMSGGAGLSHTFGVAAFPSGLVYRVGDPAPAVYLARLELRQTFGLGGGRVQVAPGPNQLAGMRDRDTLTLFAGRLSVTDVFDGNAYAHDATAQFFNWALFASGAWDYPADTRGYTWGVLADLSVQYWSLRAGIALEPKYANLEAMEWRVDKARGLMAEYEGRYEIAGRTGAARALVFLNDARMGRYQQVLDEPAQYGDNVAATREFGRIKYGFAISVDQRITETLGAFLRLSANDGATESWAFTEIDRSLGAGVVQNGAPWTRRDDEVGLGVVVNGLSTPHRRYLAGGGYGFIIGDGALDYAPELVSDLYYRAQITRFVALSGIYQFIANPAYNTARGPVHVFSARLKIAF